MHIILTHRPFWEPEFRFRVTACHDLEEAETCFIQFTAQTFDDTGVPLPEPLNDYAKARELLDHYRENGKIDEQHLIYEIGSAPEKGEMPEVPYMGQPSYDCYDFTSEQAASLLLGALSDFATIGRDVSG